MIKTIENVREIRSFLIRPFKIYTEIIYGHGNSPYRWQLRLGPRLAVHKFYRGDIDPDAHDHPAHFYTFPLQSYVETVYDPIKDVWRTNFVKAFRLHYRDATYSHRVIGRWCGLRTKTGAPILNITSTEPFWTIVWWGPQERVWGFWRRNIWVNWKEYLSGGKTWAD